MISRADIRAFVKEVAARFTPRRVILFGSYAYGHPTTDSDVDLMIVMPHHGSGAKMASRIRLACPRRFPLDLLVFSPSEFRRRTRAGDQFISEVVSKGIILHEAPDAGMGR